MFKEFREFINKGSMIDLAIGVVLGGAFSKVIDAVVGNILTPIIGLAGKHDFKDAFLTMKEGAVPGPYASLDAATKAGANVLGYGAFLTAVINFLIVGFALFLVVKAVNKARRGPIVAPVPADVVVLEEIRDLLKARAV